MYNVIDIETYEEGLVPQPQKIVVKIADEFALKRYDFLFEHNTFALNLNKNINI